MPPPVDRRVLRTRQLLRDALVRLVLERGWEEVSVKDVCDAANVGRSTFYAHFGDKEDLLLSGLDELGAWLRSSSERAPGVSLGFVRPLAAHAFEFRPMFRAVIGQQSGQAMQRKFRRMVLGLVADELGLAEADPIVRFVSGGVVEVLVVALDGRGDADAAEVDAVVQRIVARIVASDH